ncbi:MAG: lamin tail domain-containing protein [Sandaracinaceae bacterium]
MRKTISLTLLTAILALGCSESVTDDAGPPRTDAGPAGTDAGPGGTDDAGPGGTDAGPGTGDAGPMTDGGGGGADLTGLVINEIDANTEMTELYNTTSAAIDVSGYRITDDDAGMPDMMHAITFPAGTVVAPGGYLVAVEGTMPGTHQTGADCDAGDDCIHTGFGLSASAGDVIYILGPSGDDTVLITQAHPANAVPDMQSYCRLPNGTGAFAECTPTPGDVNAGP